MQTILFKVFVVVGISALALIAALGLRHQFAEFHEFVQRTPKWQRTFLALLAAVFIAYGSTKTNQVGGTALSCSPSSTMGSDILCSTSTSNFDYLPQTVTPADIARLWQVWEVRTNGDVCYTMPENATMATNWWCRGAYEDVVRVPSSGFQVSRFRFPYGSNEHCSAWAFVWGKVRFALDDEDTEIAAVGSPMSSVPYRSRLWTLETNNTFLVTWENFTLGRERLTASSQQLTALSAQIELRGNGDFITRSNEVETVYRRVDPEDWDGDGWHNDDDPNPCLWEESWDCIYHELPEGANESAYCWIEVRPKWNVEIAFYGDAPSDFEDPHIWGKAGETYRVRLLIGKTYFLESTQPLDVVGQSSPSIEIDGDGTCELSVVWPVTFSALEGNGASFVMRVVPSGLGGTFAWTQHCCGLTGYGNQFWWAHERPCWCGGCYASGWYSYEGYALECTGNQ